MLVHINIISICFQKKITQENHLSICFPLNKPAHNTVLFRFLFSKIAGVSPGSQDVALARSLEFLSCQPFFRSQMAALVSFCCYCLSSVWTKNIAALENKNMFFSTSDWNVLLHASKCEMSATKQTCGTSGFLCPICRHSTWNQLVFAAPDNPQMRCLKKKYPGSDKNAKQ